MLYLEDSYLAGSFVHGNTAVHLHAQICFSIITAMTSLGYSILTHQPDMTLVLGTFTAVVLLTLSLPRILHDPSAKWFIASVILTALARISMVNGCTGNLLDIVVDALRFTETGVCICRLLGLACFVFGSQARSIPKSKKQ